MERLNLKSRSDRYGSRINRVHSPLRARIVPYASIMIASMLPALFMAGAMPVTPPLGFIVLLGWRMVRPGLLPLWVGLPLGAFDDLFSGQPFGSAILLWSLTMLVLELLEERFPFRGFWQDWFTASLAIVLYLLAAMAASGTVPSVFHLTASGPQALLSILLYPIIALMVATLDKYRLSRVRVIR
ncbi:rod shape-determining protein MreD [Altererythrobacter lutimaris]|uniref:Rod shape-determining protein MreD n=1 Tax=Altererythrobacter lutimaris TaxID=2743979 RepID=A0A850HA25_9SPHN|nr:rod shape-determining protein MreD [Altererythrobacter lutimaris]NVE93746.1 rod shape-determining protein MreD [Altererythrobacter lutimaris]